MQESGEDKERAMTMGMIRKIKETLDPRNRAGLYSNPPRSGMSSYASGLMGIPEVIERLRAKPQPEPPKGDMPGQIQKCCFP